MNHGYIYAIAPVSMEGPVKIGLTRNDVNGRLGQIQTGHPEKLKVIAVVEVKDCVAVEKLIHNDACLKKYRMSGEWFNVPHLIAAEFVRRTGAAFEAYWKYLEESMTLSAILSEWEEGALNEQLGVKV